MARTVTQLKVKKEQLIKARVLIIEKATKIKEELKNLI